MAEAVLQAYRVEHPSPHRREVGKTALFAGVLGAPIAWAIQLMVGYGLASHACFPRDMPRFAVLPGWDWLWPTLLTLNLVMLLVAAAATVLSYRNWRSSKREMEGDHEHLIEAGEGRTRFLAVWGIWSGVWFILAIGFNTIALFGVPPCGT